MDLGYPGRALIQNQPPGHGPRPPPDQPNSNPSEGQQQSDPPSSGRDSRIIPRTLGPSPAPPGLVNHLQQQHQQQSSSSSSSITSPSGTPSGPTTPPVAATGTAVMHQHAAAQTAVASAEAAQQSAESLGNGMSNGNGNGEDWAQRTLAEMRDLTLLLSPDGRVLYASPSCAEITGFEDKSLENHDLFRYVHEDDKSFLTQELKESIQTRRLFRCHFRFCKLDSSFCLLEAHGHPHIAPSDPSSMPIGPDGGNGVRSSSNASTSASSIGNERSSSSDSSSHGVSNEGSSNGYRRLPLPISPSPPQQQQQQQQQQQPQQQPQQKQSICRGIFLVCRPYPTRGAQLLNSFLEHKIENIRLSQRIAQLKEEEEEELNATQQSFSSSSNHNHNHHNNRDAHIIHTSTTTTRQTYITTTQTVTQSTLNRMPPARDTPSSSGEDNESSDTVTSNADDDRSFPGMEGVVERLPSVDDTSHIEGIEVMTGLYYGEGERSQGLSTGQKHGRLVHCSNLAGENDPQSNRAVGDADRRKRLKGEYMCTDCGTSDSPEWRKGPEGPKTLCNACGLRWAKREKKRQDP